MRLVVLLAVWAQLCVCVLAPAHYRTPWAHTGCDGSKVVGMGGWRNLVTMRKYLATTIACDNTAKLGARARDAYDRTHARTHTPTCSRMPCNLGSPFHSSGWRTRC